MLLDKNRRRIVLHLRDPDKALAAIPTAREYPWRGRRLVVVPHGLDEARVLGKLGVDAPHPLLCYYDWPGGQTPFAAQRETAAFLTKHPRGYVLNDIGTGKTRAALWAYDYLRSIGQAKSMLVVAPLSTLDTTWGDEIFRNFPHLTYQVIHGARATRLKKLAEPADVYIINHDGFPPRPDMTMRVRAQMLTPAVGADPALARVAEDAVLFFQELRRDLQGKSPPAGFMDALNKVIGVIGAETADPWAAAQRGMTTLLRQAGVTAAHERAASDDDPNWAVLRALLAKEELSVLCIDELAVFRTATAERWRALDELARKIPRVWGLTGTPIPHLPTDAWAQCRLVTPGTVPQWFGKFRERVMNRVSTFRWAPKAEALDVVYAAMRPAVRFTREACVDLPPTLYKTVHAEMSAKQAAAYKTMMAQLAAESEAGKIIAVNEANKAMKLVQIGCGAAYTDTGEVARLEAPHRVAVTLEVIEQAAAKVIVFVPFTGALEYVRHELAKHYSVAVVQGSTPKAERTRIFHDFMRLPDPHVLVANPDAMSHGLTLVAANTIIWYAPSISTSYGQANGRITRPGQTRTTLICHVESSAVERRIYDRQAARETMQGVLLGMFAK